MEELQIRPVVFPPEVLARVAPELSLQRHLSLGIRPCLRGFQEFKQIKVDSGPQSINRYNAANSVSNPSSTVLGSSHVKSGSTFVICTITGGLVERFLPNDEADENVKEYEKIYENSDKIIEEDDKYESLANYRTVYPIVEVERGRSGPPTDEEMTVSQALHDKLFQSKLISKEALEFELGIKTIDENNKTIVIYPDELEKGDIDIANFQTSRKYAFVLYASINVFSRSGPIFDLTWLALVKALETTKLPKVYYDEKNANLLADLSSLSKKKTTKNGAIASKSNLQIVCDPVKNYHLRLNRSNTFSTTIGVVSLEKDYQVEVEETAEEELLKTLDLKSRPQPGQHILLCDIEGDAEENMTTSRISVVPIIDENDEDDLVGLTINGSGVKITKEVISESIRLAKLNSSVLKSQ